MNLNYNLNDYTELTGDDVFRLGDEIWSPVYGMEGWSPIGAEYFGNRIGWNWTYGVHFRRPKKLDFRAESTPSPWKAEAEKLAKALRDVVVWNEADIDRLSMLEPHAMAIKTMLLKRREHLAETLDRWNLLQ